MNSETNLLHVARLLVVLLSAVVYTNEGPQFCLILEYDIGGNLTNVIFHDKLPGHSSFDTHKLFLGNDA